jgi:hypothetical protein
MLGIEELKCSIVLTSKTVECPVEGCNVILERMRKGDEFRAERFKCQKHGIYVSPSTFEYQSDLDNFLWKDENEINLWREIKKIKRECWRIPRERSEDAVTWNIFRFLEKNNMIPSFLEKFLNIIVSDSEIIYWSYSQSQKDVWNMLTKARNEFETNPSKGTEPDLIIVSSNNLAIIEAKLGQVGQDPYKSPIDLETVKKVKYKYMSGGKEWWNEVFYSDFWDVAFENRQYELTRLWLIGTWMAKELGLNFQLVSLIRSEQSKRFELAFGRYIKSNDKRKLTQITWEEIYSIINSALLISDDKNQMIGYFKNKTIGYNNEGKLQKAFLL